MSLNRFSNQTAIVTGATSGLGLAITRRLQAEGAFVVAFDCNPKAFKQFAGEFGAHGSCLEVDVTNESKVQAAIQSVVAQRNRIDVLVNSAGVTG